MSIESRLKKAETMATANHKANSTQPCKCAWGKRRAYFVIEGMTDEETREDIPYNARTCPRCGGARFAIYGDKTDLRA